MAPTLPLMSATQEPNKTLGLSLAMSTKGAYIETNVCATRGMSAKEQKQRCSLIVDRVRIPSDPRARI